jgi:hypothetical protein
MTEGMAPGAPGAAWNLGQPGASALAEYERLRQDDAARRQKLFGRYLGPVVGALAPPNPRAVAWSRGGQGELEVGRYLTSVIDRAGVVLHDRAIPNSRANIDHIAVVPTGVWVIDTKRYRGRVEQRGGWLRSSTSLVVNHHNRTNLVAAALRQRQLVQRVVGPKVPVQSVLCFTDAEWGFLGRPFSMNDVLITWPRKLGASLREAGGLPQRTVEELATTLSAAFPAYAPGGTSHNPTGASPRG